ncbi:hypothetical protein [Flavobacterium nackdongense]|uniref:Uncharacterized protein n=1 Tax=Flavobacterium nackdongense TaxID=2547394 RepID=A0A4P6Y857_9FLAO|nr:hypothetical protein [Flavobacterium nackdongense]QBN18971.1 hypothetical protein E1750_09195 [Flavobacterium nackdongense]
MTFEEASYLKNEIGETKTIEDKTYKVFIVPSNEKDFTNYLVDFRTTKFNDNSSKLYSKNSEFKVYAIWSYNSNFLIKELKL